MSDIESFFTPKDLKDIKYVFNTFDTDQSGSIDDKELAQALERLGEKVDEKRVAQLIEEVDLDKDGTIDFKEFLVMVKSLREGKGGAMADVYKKQATLYTVAGETGQHSYSEEECEAFVDYINGQLADDPDLSHLLPMKNDGLFDGVKDGILLCKLINSAVPDTIDERVINKKKNNNPWERNENHTLAVNSAKAIGVSTVNVGPDDLNEGRPHIVLGIVWQIIKIGLLKDINLKEHKELVLLLKDGETMEDLLKLPPEDLLLRWFNYHLEAAGHHRRVANFSGDIKDSENYTVLLKQIAPNKECDMSPMQESDLTERAEKMLEQAAKIDCRKFVSARDVVKGNPRLNLAFVANLFNHYPALFINEDEYDFADLLDFDEEGTREERAFRFWIQSLGIDVNNLFEDSKDGLMLLKVEDKVQPGVVDWKKVDQKPKMKFHKIGNCNLVVEYAKKMNLSVVNIGGPDIHEGQKKLILAIVWQLMRQSLLNVLAELGGGQKITDADLLAWANSKVSDMQIESFKDPSLRTGVFLCKLCAAVAPKSVNTDFITPGETDEDAEQNAKYAISVARKINAPVFCLWEDLVEVKSKMILSFIGSLMIVDRKGVN